MSKKKKILLLCAVLILVGAAISFVVGKKYWGYIYMSNTKVDTKVSYIYIPTNSNYEDVINILDKSGYIINIESFKFVAKQKKYNQKILPGKYEIRDRMSNNEIVNILRSGKQTPVRLSFISLRNLNILAGKISTFIETDSTNLADSFKSKEVISKYGFNSNTFMAMFIPNTYEFYWNTSAEKFVDRIYDEYNKFWNNNRVNKANELGLSKLEVSILASIVEEETQKNDEKSRVAGVYINRLNKDMLLQADPTVKFAIGNPLLKRILNKHLTVDSPYNTYVYPGLPPGPICIPSISSIDAVLNYEKHNYLFFCAKDDFSGYHNFAISLGQHNINAKKYHDALRRAGIK